MGFLDKVGENLQEALGQARAVVRNMAAMAPIRAGGCPSRTGGFPAIPPG